MQRLLTAGLCFFILFSLFAPSSFAYYRGRCGFGCIDPCSDRYYVRDIPRYSCSGDYFCGNAYWGRWQGCTNCYGEVTSYCNCTDPGHCYNPCLTPGTYCDAFGNIGSDY